MSTRSRRAIVAVIAAAAIMAFYLFTALLAIIAQDDASRDLDSCSSFSNGATLFGTSLWSGPGETAAQSLARRDATMAPLGVARVFYGDRPAPWSGPVGQAGRPLVVSFRPAPSVVLSGALDGYLRDWFASAPTDRPTWWSYWHEPENDLGLDLGQYRAAWRHLRGLADQAGNPNLSATLILMTDTLRAGNSRDFEDYYPGDDVIQTLAWDSYHYDSGHFGEWGSFAERQATQPFVALSQAHGKPWAIAEFGAETRGPARAAWLRESAAWLAGQGASFVTYFDSKEGGNFTLDDAESMQAWADVMGGGVPQVQPASMSAPTEQMAVALEVIRAGVASGVPAEGLVIALMTGLQESGLRALDYGDRDSIGVFQQRTPWGPVSVRMDPYQSAMLFFNGGMGGQRGLLDIPGWESMPLWEAAQAVQVSAFPTAYARHEGAARAILAASGQAVPVVPASDLCGTMPIANAMNCPDSALAIKANLQPNADAVTDCVMAGYAEGIASIGGYAKRNISGTDKVSDHALGLAVDVMLKDWSTPQGRAFGWSIAEWAKDNALALGVHYVVFDRKIWNAERNDEGWRPYSHPGGTSNATLDHLDHVHISVYSDEPSDG